MQFVAKIASYLQTMARRNAMEIASVERDLLLELAKGKKTFEQIAIDARRLSARGTALPALTGSNPARCISQRLAELTGISKDSLHFFDVQCTAEAADPALHCQRMRLPFVLLSTHIE